jgi:GNAT superfamily N-acetyltransferase
LDKATQEHGPDQPKETTEAGYEIRSLPVERYDEARVFAHDYLGESGGELFGECIQANPELALDYEDGEGRMIGLCFGMPRNVAPDEVALQGIVIRRDVAAKGLGSKLLAQFEQVVASHGYTKICLGSADGHVEHFT